MSDIIHTKHRYLKRAFLEHSSHTKWRQSSRAPQTITVNLRRVLLMFALKLVMRLTSFWRFCDDV